MPLKYTHLYQEWVKMYRTGMSMAKIAKVHHVHPQAVMDGLVRSNEKIRTKSQAIRKYQIDENVFDILTPEAVYWLGFLYADGGMTSAGKNLFTIGLTVAEKDKLHLDKWAKFIGGGVRVIKRPDKKAYYCSVTNKHLCHRLIELGVIQRKSLILKFPEWIDYSMAPDFMRGYFDGDGTINVRIPKRYISPQPTVSIASSLDFCDGYGKAMAKFIGVGVPKVMRRKKIGQISWSGTRQVAKIFRFFYGHGGVLLERKHNKMAPFKDRDIIRS